MIYTPGGGGYGAKSIERESTTSGNVEDGGVTKKIKLESSPALQNSNSTAYMHRGSLLDYARLQESA